METPYQQICKVLKSQGGIISLSTVNPQKGATIKRWEHWKVNGCLIVIELYCDGETYQMYKPTNEEVHFEQQLVKDTKIIKELINPIWHTTKSLEFKIDSNRTIRTGWALDRERTDGFSSTMRKRNVKGEGQMSVTVRITQPVEGDPLNTPLGTIETIATIGKTIYIPFNTQSEADDILQEIKDLGEGIFTKYKNY